MNVTKYVSVDTIFAKLRRDIGLEDINEGDVIEWAGEALDAIEAIPEYEEAVAFVEVKDHQAILPIGLHSIIQVARNNQPPVCPEEVLQCGCQDNPEEEVVVTEPGPSFPVRIDCDGSPIDDYDLAYYRPYFDLNYEYHGWCNHKSFEQFTPVRLANHSFMSSLVCEELNEDVKKLYQNSHDEYTVINNGDCLRLSFKEGQVAIAYTRQRLSEEGYPLIPDNYSYITAITKYITLKMAERYWFNGRKGYEGKVTKLESDWQWYCKQAGNYSLAPKGIDQHQNMMEQRQYLLPRVNRYYQFFGNMSRRENRVYNDPDYRNYNQRTHVHRN